MKFKKMIGLTAFTFPKKSLINVCVLYITKNVVGEFDV